VQYNITITAEGSTDLGLLKDKNAVIRRLTLTGKGKLDACILTFGKKGDSKYGQKDLLFLKPLHEKSEILMPHIKGFHTTDYDYCTLQVLTGNIMAGDEIKLYLTTDTGA
jgi:hypothetical protein